MISWLCGPNHHRARSFFLLLPSLSVDSNAPMMHPPQSPFPCQCLAPKESFRCQQRKSGRAPHWPGLEDLGETQRDSGSCVWWKHSLQDVQGGEPKVSADPVDHRKARQLRSRDPVRRSIPRKHERDRLEFSDERGYISLSDPILCQPGESSSSKKVYIS